MIYVVAKSCVKEDKIADYIKLAKRLVTETNAHDQGCIQYELFQDVSNPQIFTIMEQWESKEALDRHMNAKHFKEIVPLLGNYREGTGDLNIYQKVK